MNCDEVIKRLLEDGWILKRSRGSHRQFVHPKKPGRVTVAIHKGDIKPATLKSIERQSGLKF